MDGCFGFVETLDWVLQDMTECPTGFIHSELSRPPASAPGEEGYGNRMLMHHPSDQQNHHLQPAATKKAAVNWVDPRWSERHYIQHTFTVCVEYSHCWCFNKTNAMRNLNTVHENEI